METGMRLAWQRMVLQHSLVAKQRFQRPCARAFERVAVVQVL